MSCARAAGSPDEIYGFHVQQAAEKLLKSWIALLGESYPLTHSIETLLKLLADRGIDTAPFLELSAYTPYAVEFRYAGVGPDAKPIVRAGALEAVEALLERVGSQLPEGGGP